MPRVGSKQSIVCTPPATQRAIVTFCWLPPDSRRTSLPARASIWSVSTAEFTMRSLAKVNPGPSARCARRSAGQCSRARSAASAGPLPDPPRRTRARPDGVGRDGGSWPACRRPRSAALWRWAPERMSNSSSWPWPSRATTPSTSPGKSSNVDVVQSRRCSACAHSRRGVTSRRRWQRAASRARAAQARRSRPASAPRSVLRTGRRHRPRPTVSPSRRTVARSQSAAISIMRCEMKMTDSSPPRGDRRPRAHARTGWRAARR